MFTYSSWGRSGPCKELLNPLPVLSPGLLDVDIVVLDLLLCLDIRMFKCPLALILYIS